MKNKENRNKTIIICSLAALCVAVLAGTYFLTREPENEFIPAPAQIETPTGSWDENAGVDTPAPTGAFEESTQTAGSAADHTQSLISEDENGSTSSLSDSTTRQDAEDTKPTETPEATGDVTDPDNPPTYEDPTVKQPDTTNTTPPADTGSGDGHAGQVYDPVFGWIDTGNTQQDNVDSGGDINKQIGTMGGN